MASLRGQSAGERLGEHLCGTFWVRHRFLSCFFQSWFLYLCYSYSCCGASLSVFWFPYRYSVNLFIVSLNRALRILSDTFKLHLYHKNERIGFKYLGRKDRFLHHSVTCHWVIINNVSIFFIDSVRIGQNGDLCRCCKYLLTLILIYYS